jgi:hypothetical protein
MMGAFTHWAGTAVSFISLNLLKSLPDFTPHQSVAYANASVVRLSTKQPLFLMMLYEWRDLRTEM